MFFWIIITLSKFSSKFIFFIKRCSLIDKRFPSTKLSNNFCIFYLKKSSFLSCSYFRSSTFSVVIFEGFFFLFLFLYSFDISISSILMSFFFFLSLIFDDRPLIRFVGEFITLSIWNIRLFISFYASAFKSWWIKKVFYSC